MIDRDGTPPSDLRGSVPPCDLALYTRRDGFY